MKGRTLGERLFRTSVRFVYGTWYGAGLCFSASIFFLTLLFVLTGILRGQALKWVSAATGSAAIVFFAFLLNEIAAVAVSMVRRRWALAVTQFFVGAGLVLMTVFVSVMMCACGLTGPSEDDFGLRHPAPVGPGIREPLKDAAEHECRLETCDDPFSQCVLRAAVSTGRVESTIEIDLSSLARLADSRRTALVEYLAAHPAWRLQDDGGGGMRASRRWKVRGRWMPSSSGYYSGRGFQVGVFIRLAGAEGTYDSDAGYHPLVTALWFGDVVGNGDGMTVRLAGTGVSVEVFAQGEREWGMVCAALSFLMEEFVRLEATGSEDEARALLPDDAVATGAERFTLRDCHQGGIYDLALRVNPGEPGSVHVKAFEAMRMIPLSSGEIASATNERIGWSNDANERFLSTAEFIVDEGDWGDCYAARIEVWFRPASGAPERKLMERTYRIQGWQR